MSFEYMTKEGCGSGVFLFRPLLALAALWSSTQMQLRRCLKCGWGIVPETLHLSLPLLSLPMFFFASTSPAEFGSPFFPLFCQACHRCRPPLNPKLSSLSGSCLQCPYMRGATKCVGQRHGVRWWAAQGAWSDGSLGLKGTDGQGQAEKVDLWLQSKDHSISLHRILLRLA